MDEDIRASLTEIKQTTKEGFAEIKGEIKTLVTQGEFNATIQRVDSSHAQLRNDFDMHVNWAEKKLQDSDAAAKLDREKLRSEVHGEFEAQRVSNRWAIGLSVTISGILFGVITWAVQTF